MAGNSRFHNKLHQTDHHTNATPGIPGSGGDPIASAQSPFQGDFYLAGGLSASGSFTVGGNMTIIGNLSAMGDTTFINTNVTVTSALSVLNTGTSPAFTVRQTGNQPVALFYDDNTLALSILDGGTVAAGSLSANSLSSRYINFTKLSASAIPSTGTSQSNLFLNLSGDLILTSLSGNTVTYDPVGWGLSNGYATVSFNHTALTKTFQAEYNNNRSRGKALSAAWVFAKTFVQPDSGHVVIQVGPGIYEVTDTLEWSPQEYEYVQLNIAPLPYVTPRIRKVQKTGTDPYNSNAWKTGFKITGVGMYDSVIRLVPPETPVGSGIYHVSGWGTAWDNTQTNSAGASSYNDGKYVIKNQQNSNTNSLPSNSNEVSNLTVDANWFGLNFSDNPGFNKVIDCISLLGSNNTVRNVRAINFYGAAGQGAWESFPIQITSGYHLYATNALMEGCIIESPAGTYSQGVSIGGGVYGGIPSVLDGVVIRNNVFNGLYESGSVGIGYTKNVEIYGNVFTNAGNVLHQDTGSLDGLSFHNNRISNCRYDPVFLYNTDDRPSMLADELSPTQIVYPAGLTQGTIYYIVTGGSSSSFDFTNVGVPGYTSQYTFTATKTEAPTNWGTSTILQEVTARYGGIITAWKNISIKDNYFEMNYDTNYSAYYNHYPTSDWRSTKAYAGIVDYQTSLSAINGNKPFISMYSDLNAFYPNSRGVFQNVEVSNNHFVTLSSSATLFAVNHNLPLSASMQNKDIKIFNNRYESRSSLGNAALVCTHYIPSPGVYGYPIGVPFYNSLSSIQIYGNRYINGDTIPYFADNISYLTTSGGLSTNVYDSNIIDPGFKLRTPLSASSIAQIKTMSFNPNFGGTETGTIVLGASGKNSGNVIEIQTTGSGGELSRNWITGSAAGLKFNNSQAGGGIIISDGPTISTGSNSIILNTNGAIFATTLSGKSIDTPRLSAWNIVGQCSNATGIGANALGCCNTASGDSSTVIGGFSGRATGCASIVGGLSSRGSGRAAVAFGEGAYSIGQNSTVGGGFCNCAIGNYSTVGGGINNCTICTNTTIAGGGYNCMSGESSYSTIGGGNVNIIAAGQSTIGGGSYNTISNDYATIGGGNSNTGGSSASVIGGGICNCTINSGSCATIGGGACNRAFGESSTVVGGFSGSATGVGSIVGGLSSRASGRAAVAFGEGNIAAGYQSFIGGGSFNTISAVSTGLYPEWVDGVGGTIGGGSCNSIGSRYSTIGGGFNNSTCGCFDFSWSGLPYPATIGGGSYNKAYGAHSTIGGGGSNCIDFGHTGSTIGGGEYNCVFTDYTFIGGGFCNIVTALGDYSTTIGGGECNLVMGACATIAGGLCNCILDHPYSTIGGGAANITCGIAATVAGGISNSACDENATVAGGSSNCAMSLGTTVGGGFENSACSIYATVGGGVYNVALSACSTVVGGFSGQATGVGSIVGGLSSRAGGRAAVAFGEGNIASGDQSFVGGGNNNCATGSDSTIGGGNNNYATQINAFIGGGNNNCATQANAFVGGGGSNAACSCFSTIAGGYGNTTLSAYGTIAGGVNNRTADQYGTIAGGSGNTTLSAYATIVGGYNNCSNNIGTIAGGLSSRATGRASIAFGENVTSTGINSTVGGGYTNCAGCNCTTVAGGTNNSAVSVLASVGGGCCNCICGPGTSSTVGGGQYNCICDSYSIIGGGSDNHISGSASTIGGGTGNRALSNTVTIGGGCQHTAAGVTSTIGGGVCHCTPGQYSTIGGGCSNATIGTQSTVGGGLCNLIYNCANFSMIGSGCCNTICCCAVCSSILGGAGNMMCCTATNTSIIGSNITAVGCCRTYVNALEVIGCSAACNVASYIVLRNPSGCRCGVCINASNALTLFTAP